jgi:diguanylate cyclase (GGDEF)-like protein
MMGEPDHPEYRPLPPHVFVLSLASFAVPASAPFLLPAEAADIGALLWLLGLVPAFLVAYYRGWRGVATALAAGMATLSTSQALAVALGFTIGDQPVLALVLTLYLSISFGLGWLSELFLRDGDAARRLALIDELTGLPNRRHARLFLDKEFAAARRGRLLAVVIFDLDDFKGFNDRHGHVAGDAALRGFAHVLASATRAMNLSARYAGEEFLSIVSEATPDAAVAFAERVRTALARNQPQVGALTVSAGVAGFDPAMGSIDDLIAAADAALYRAKAGGRDRVYLADAPLKLVISNGG